MSPGVAKQLLRSLPSRDLLLALAMVSRLITVPCRHNRLLFFYVRDEPLEDHTSPGGDGTSAPSKCTPSTRPAGDSEIARLAQVESLEQIKRLSISQSRRRKLRGVSSRLSIVSISCLKDFRRKRRRWKRIAWLCPQFSPHAIRFRPRRIESHCQFPAFRVTYICALDRIGLEQLSPQQPVTCASFFRIPPA